MRRYDTAVLHRLAVIQRARQTGFTLNEIRGLFFGFRDRATASQRWQNLRQETGGTCGVDAADQDDAAFAAEDDGLLPWRNFGSMWQGDI
jgi:DNA-binding transcriptional MerR regulator